ncbi:MAG: tetratricopeptide repeat protein [Balneolaceae bacterium]
MKSLSSIYIFSFAFLFAVTGFTTEVEGQGQEARTEATMAYNNARELAQEGEFLDAIELYRESLNISRSADCEDCGDIAELVENQLPRVYFSRATSAFETFRNDRSVSSAEQAVEYFEDAAEAGEEFGDDQVRDRSRSVIPQVYYNMAVAQYSQEDYSGAIENLDRAIELNANYTLPYYQKALALDASGAGLDEVLGWFDTAIEVGERMGESETVERAKRRAGTELVYQSVQRINEDRYNDALRMLERAAEYVPDNEDLHYRLAEVYNGRGEYNTAIEHANRALELESGGVSDMAKIYFELGIAYKGLEQVSNACNAFEDAAYGDFRDPAMHEMEYELECEGYAAAENGS